MINNKESSTFYFNRGIAKSKQNKLEESIRDYNKAIELNPNYINAYFNRGVVYGKQKKIVDAIRDYTKAIELNPNYTNAYINRGNAYKN